MTDPLFSVHTDNGRYYVNPNTGNSVPSITNIIGMKDKPGLKWWGAKEVASYVSHNLELFRQPNLTEEQAFSLARYTPFARSDESAAAIGDIVHGWVERYVKAKLGQLGEGETAPTHDEVKHANQTAQWMWDRFIRFNQHYSQYGLEYTGSEFTVWSEKYGYAGTGDLSMRINGVHVLADVKTGKNVYPDTGMQLAALSKADIMLDRDGREGSVPGYDKYMILHIRPRSFTPYPVTKIDEAFECFLALKTVFDWNLRTAPQTIEFAAKHN